MRDVWQERYVQDLVAENDRLRAKIADLERVRDAYIEAAKVRCERIRVLEQALEEERRENDATLTS